MTGETHEAMGNLSQISAGNSKLESSAQWKITLLFAVAVSFCPCTLARPIAPLSFSWCQTLEHSAGLQAGRWAGSAGRASSPVAGKGTARAAQPLGVPAPNY